MSTRTKGLLAAGGVVAAVAGAIAGIRAARLSLAAALWASRAATFRLRRRCPDCAERIRYEARVCRYCGRRLRPAPGR